MPAANGFPHRLSAMPHSAMAQPGSAFSAAVKLSIAGANSNECSRAIARANAGCAAGVHEVANRTVPSFSSTGVLVILLPGGRRGQDDGGERERGKDVHRWPPP